MENLEVFSTQILKNLEQNGFPAKKVSFDLELLYEKADQKELSLNKVLDHLKEQHQIDHDKTVEKIIFSKAQEKPEINQEMFEQAQQMMGQMDPEEIKRMQQMYESMSEEEKQNLMQQAKKMGLMG